MQAHEGKRTLWFPGTLLAPPPDTAARSRPPVRSRIAANFFKEIKNLGILSIFNDCIKSVFHCINRFWK